MNEWMNEWMNKLIDRGKYGMKRGIEDRKINEHIEKRMSLKWEFYLRPDIVSCSICSLYLEQYILQAGISYKAFSYST